MPKLGTIIVSLFFGLLFATCSTMAFTGAGTHEIGQPGVRAGSINGPVVVGGGPRTGK